MSTEGLFSELFEGIRHTYSDEFRLYRQKMKKFFRDHPDDTVFLWSRMERACVLLMSMALDEECSEEEVLEEMEYLRSCGLLMEEYRGIHIASRRLPAHFWETQIRAWCEMKKHPLCLIDWKDLTPDEAKYVDSCAVIRFRLAPCVLNGSETAWIRFRVKQMPERVTLNGEELDFSVKKGILHLDLTSEGTLCCHYK